MKTKSSNEKTLLQRLYFEELEIDPQAFKSEKDCYAKMLVYAYFMPQKNLLFIINREETRWGTICSDGCGLLDNILDYENERYSRSYSEGTFTTVFNKAKEEYEKCPYLRALMDNRGIYPYLNEKLCPFEHEMTYSLLIEIGNCIDDNAWRI